MGRYVIKELDQVGRTYRNIFLRGLMVVVPIFISLALLLYVYQFVESRVGAPMNQLAMQAMVDTEWGRWAALELLEVDPAYQDAPRAELLRQVELRYPRWLGIVLAALGVFAVGALITSIVGRRLWPAVEHRLGQLPVVRHIYPYARQLGQFLFHQARIKGFRGVVAFPFPREGAWSLGFVTSEGITQIDRKTEADTVAVLVPFGCGPYAWVSQVQSKDVVPVDMTVEEAIRFFITNGLLLPERWQQGGDEAPSADR